MKALRALLKQWTAWLGTSPDLSLSVLAVMPNPADRLAIRQICHRAHWQLQVCDTFDSAVDRLRGHSFAAILCDRDLPRLDWREAVATLSTKAPRTSVILASPIIDDVLWQEVIQRGGCDVLTKPFQEERVVKTISFACSKK